MLNDGAANGAAEGGVPLGGPEGDVDEIKSAISKAVSEMTEIDKSRLSLNEDAGAIKARLEKLGIPRSVFQAAYRYYKTDPDKRDGFDIAYQLCREAIGLPIQGDMFKAQKGKTKAKKGAEQDRPTA